jgi:hypothetical protein
MGHDERELQELLGKLRLRKGLCPMSDEEAEAAFNAAPEDTLSDDEIRSAVGSVQSGELCSWEPLPELGWMQDMDLSSVQHDALQLYRNKGDDDSEAIDAEEKLRKEMLSDEDE